MFLKSLKSWRSRDSRIFSGLKKNKSELGFPK
jgi:hypothetical protein